MITIGIDPDTHHTSLVILDGTRVKWAHVLTVPRKLTGKAAVYATIQAAMRLPDTLPDVKVDMIVVEAMQVYGDAPEKANSLLPLSTIGGAVMAILSNKYPNAGICLPKPPEWKGQVPKKIHHKRILKALENAEALTSSHLIDAGGLAQWGQTTKAHTLSDLRLLP